MGTGYAMTHRLKSNCSVISSMNVLFMVRVYCLSCLSLWLCVMAMPGYLKLWKYGVSNPCLKPPKHESCDVRCSNLLSPSATAASVILWVLAGGEVWVWVCGC